MTKTEPYDWKKWARKKKIKSHTHTHTKSWKNNWLYKQPHKLTKGFKQKTIQSFRKHDIKTGWIRIWVEIKSKCIGQGKFSLIHLFYWVWDLLVCLRSTYVYVWKRWVFEHTASETSVTCTFKSRWCTDLIQCLAVCIQQVVFWEVLSYWEFLRAVLTLRGKQIRITIQLGKLNCVKVRHPFSTSFFLFLSSLALKFKQTTTATTALKFYPQILTACPQNNWHRLVTAWLVVVHVPLETEMETVLLTETKLCSPGGMVKRTQVSFSFWLYFMDWPLGYCACAELGRNSKKLGKR